ncbi:MAG TPA: ATPase [Gammaproteobacteria bacterium]|nr:ATPase [Gammaproteobacteria bacterium]
MHMTPEEFRSSPTKRITLLGMSGVGKTRLSSLLPREQWYHYSGDYRIGSHYLDEPILDNIKRKMMHIPFLRDLLRSDSIHIYNNISFENLHPVSSFLGKVGDPDKGGLSLTEFQHRQQLHHDAEVAAMLDVPHFIEKARVVYDYTNFINDAGGSLCELDSPQVMETLAEHTLILYIRATRSDRERLIERAISDPKPLYFPPDFLLQRLNEYRQQQHIDYVAMIDPDDFARWVFPHLFESRIPRYDAIAAQYGYTISSEEVFELRSEDDFMRLVEHALHRENH